MDVRMFGQTEIYLSGPVLRLSHTCGIAYMRLYSHWMVSEVTALSGVEAFHAKRPLAWIYFHAAIKDWEGKRYYFTSVVDIACLRPERLSSVIGR